MMEPEQRKKIVAIPHGRDDLGKLPDLLRALSKFSKDFDEVIIATRDKNNVEKEVKKYDYRNKVTVVDESDWRELVDSADIHQKYKRVLRSHITTRDYGGMRNILMAFAAKHSGGRMYLFFLDDDVVPPPNYIAEVMGEFERIGKKKRTEPIAIVGQYKQNNVVSLEWLASLLRNKNRRNDVVKYARGIKTPESEIRRDHKKTNTALGGAYSIRDPAHKVPFVACGNCPIPMRGEDDIHVKKIIREYGDARKCGDAWMVPVTVDHRPDERRDEDVDRILKGDFVGHVVWLYQNSYNEDEAYNQSVTIFMSLIRNILSNARHCDRPVYDWIIKRMRNLGNFIEDRNSNRGGYKTALSYINAYNELQQAWKNFIDYVESSKASIESL